MSSRTTKAVATTVGTIAVGIAVYLGVNTDGQQTPEQVREQARQELRTNVLTAIDAYHEAVTGTIQSPELPAVLKLKPGRIYIDCNYSDEVMAEVFAAGDSKVHSIGAKSWTTDDAQLVVSWDKWATFLKTYQAPHSGLAYLDWEKEWRNRLVAGDAAALADGRTALEMAKAMRPDIHWGWYGLGVNPREWALRDVFDDLQREAEYIVVPIYEEYSTTPVEGMVERIRTKIERGREIGNGRPLLVQDWLMAKDGKPLSEPVLQARAAAVNAVGVDGYILFDTTQPKAGKVGFAEAVVKQRETYHAFRAAIDGDPLPAPPDVTPTPEPEPEPTPGLNTVDLSGAVMQRLEVQPNTRYQNGTVENVVFAGGFTGRVELVGLTIGGRGLEVACESLLIDRCTIKSSHYAVINRGDGTVRSIVCRNSHFEQTNGSQATFRLHGVGSNTLEATGCMFVNDFGHKALRVYTYAGVRLTDCEFRNGSQNRLNASAIDIGIHANDPRDTSGVMGCGKVELSGCRIVHNGGDVSMRIGFNQMLVIDGLTVTTPYSRPWNGGVPGDGESGLIDMNTAGSISGVTVNGKAWAEATW